MNNTRYCGSLHNHTEDSNIRLRDSTNRAEELINYAGELGHKVVGITEHEFIGNWVKIEKISEKVKEKHPDLKIIRGNEIYLCRNGLNHDNFERGKDKYYHFILLALDEIGAKQIMEISTRAWRRSYMAYGMRRVPTYYQDLFDIIASNQGHVVGSSACLGGALPTQILRGTSDEKLGLWINQMNSIFGHGNFYLEMQPSENKEQIIVNKKLLEFSKQYDVKYIITTDSHYLKKEDRIIHKTYLKAQSGEREIDDFYATTYLMGDEEIRSFFPYFTEEELRKGYDAIEEIGNKAKDYSIRKPLQIPTLKWKEYKVDGDIEFWYERIPYLKTFSQSDYIGDRELVKAIIEGINSHPDLQNQKAYDEINSNLNMTWVSSNVNKAHWSAYFLNLQNIIDLCWKAGSLVGPGRGSGVGFILLYVLGITQINPLRETTKCFSWRFLNPERVSPLDVDFDIEGGRRNNVLSMFRQYYGDDRVANVATFRTEKSKSAILTACRGLGVDSDTAQYLASLVPSDRGQLRTLKQCMYGDDENGWTPIKAFVQEMTNNYPDVWKVASNIEGLICGSGVHQGGVIFVDEPFTESTALMRAPDGTICTQFELHDCEACSLIKYDALSVEAMDKIHVCLDLLCDYGYMERKSSLRETYETYLGIYNIERKDKAMWELVWNHKINSLFQFEGRTGLIGIDQLKPTSVDDLAILNSTIRLMSQEKGGEMPTEKLARFKKNRQEWEDEMDKFHLTKEEKRTLEPVLGMSYGLCIAQEQFMELVQLPELGEFSLTWADKLRKSIQKKKPAEYNKLTEEFFKVTSEKGINQEFAHYVWDILIAMSRGYGFNQSHTLAYSLVALQEMNLAYKYPIIFWNCACLITDAGGDVIEQMENEEEEEEIEYVNEVENFEDEEEDEDDEENEKVNKKKKEEKKKTKTNNYGKIASAIGKMIQEGIKVAPPNINKSSYTFSPDVKNNRILYGMSGILKIGEELVQKIIDNRPYTSVLDFLSKVKVNKTQLVNLIKCGAFDEFGDRRSIMYDCLGEEAGVKKKLTLQNVGTLINYKLLPEELDFERRVFNYNKYLRKLKNKETDRIEFDDVAMEFYEKNFDLDLTKVEDGICSIAASTWKKIYDSYMANVKKYIVANHDELLKKLNGTLIKEIIKKYASGTTDKWSMDSVCFYQDHHELEYADLLSLGVEDFWSLPEQPQIASSFKAKDGHIINLFKLTSIAGTVIDKDKLKSQITLLTTNGVVIVQAYGVMQQYDKQISEVGADGKKHIIERSWFQRGTKLIVNGMRRGENIFVAKKYGKDPNKHHFILIKEIHEDGSVELQTERVEVNAG